MIKTTDRRKIPGLFFFTIIVVTFYIFLVQLTAVVPAEMRVSVGERVDLNNLFPSCISTRLTALVFEEEGVLKCQDGCKEIFSLQQGQNPLAVIPGDVKLDLRLFGLIPFKKVTLQVVPPISVMAGGHSIGVLMNSEGVLAVGCSDIILENGKKSCPARDVGISPGTAILNVEGRKVHSDTHLSFLIDHFAREKDTIHLDVIYKGKKRKIKIKPQFCSETGRYRIGLLVQDGASGVGTLTFYDPQTKKYGALGHLITNSEGNKSREFKDGRIVPASVQRIHKGEEGKIGEKVGYFAGKGATGKINKNTQVGIFGKLEHNLSNPIFPEPIPVAMGHQIKEGPATILTVLNNHSIEAFQISIQNVFSRPRSDGKAFVIKVTDIELIRRTGGIVQGMSGSPIIQDGKLVGAVTHVLVNDPTRGYGVLSEMMLEEAGLLPEQKRGNITGYYGAVSENST
jgi:stage IV sporulation protein B